jgi:hypothetical protein
LAAPCDRGPAYPTADAMLDEWVPILEAREAAAKDCRDRQRRLVEAWPK